MEEGRPPLGPLITGRYNRSHLLTGFPMTRRDEGGGLGWRAAEAEWETGQGETERQKSSLKAGRPQKCGRQSSHCPLSPSSSSKRGRGRGVGPRGR